MKRRLQYYWLTGLKFVKEQDRLKVEIELKGGRRNKSPWGRQITGSLLKLFLRGKPMEENNKDLR